MSWPQWPQGVAPPVSAVPAVVAPPVINPAPAVVNPAAPVLPPQYTQEQWSQLQQQNWHQWAQWQQQYQQWHQQYGAEYQKSMNALAQATQPPPVQPPMHNLGVPPPPPQSEIKPPLPTEEPPPPPSSHFPGALPNLTNYNQAPPPPVQPPMQQGANMQPSMQQMQQGANMQPSMQQMQQGANLQQPSMNLQQSNNYARPNQNWSNQPPRMNEPTKRLYDESDEFDSKRHMPNRHWQQQQSSNNQNTLIQNKPPPALMSLNLRPAAAAPVPASTAPELSKPRDNSEELSEAEKKFDKQFADWEAQFNKWKEQNMAHPDKTQYREYEKKWESWRAQLLERREQMKRKRLGLAMDASKNSPQYQAPKPVKPPPLVPQNQPQSLMQQSQTTPPLMPQNRNLRNEPLPNRPSMQDDRFFNKGIKSQGPRFPDHPEHYDKQFHAPSAPSDASLFNKPPPFMNDEPLQFKSSRQPAIERVVPEEVPVEDFIKPNEGGGIPGLDLVKEGDKAQTDEDDADDEKKNVELEAISKGINNILGDQKLLNMLSLVTQGQGQQLPDKVTNIQSDIKESGENPEVPQEHSNLSFEGQTSTGEGPQREAIQNFDDQTRSSFTMGQPDHHFENANDRQFGAPDRFSNFAQFGPDRNKFGPRGNFGPNDGPGRGGLGMKDGAMSRGNFGPNLGPNRNNFGKNDGPFGQRNNFGPNDGSRDNFEADIDMNDAPQNMFEADDFDPSEDNFGPNDGPRGNFGPRGNNFGPNDGKRGNFGPNDGPPDNFGPMNKSRGGFGPNDGPPRGNFGSNDGPLRGNFGANNGPPPGSFGPNDGPPRGNFGPNDGPSRGNFGPNDGPPRGNFGFNDGPPRGNFVSNDGPPRGNFGPNDGPSRGNFGRNDGPSRGNFTPNDGPSGGNFGPNDGPPRSNIGPNDGPPRGNFGPNDGPPRGNFEPNDDPSRGNFGPNNGPPRGNFGPNAGPSRAKLGLNDGPPRGSFGPNNDGPPRGNFGFNDGPRDNFGPNDGPRGNFGLNDGPRDNFGPSDGPRGNFGPNNKSRGNFGPNDGPRGNFGPNEGPRGNFGPNDGPRGNFGPNDGPRGNFGPNDGPRGNMGWNDGPGDKFGPNPNQRGGNFGLSDDFRGPNKGIPSLMGNDYEDPGNEFEEPPYEDQWEDQPENMPNDPPKVTEELLEPSAVIDYDHKSLKNEDDFEVLIEPIYMYDYRHTSLRRIPLSQRPKWLSDTVRSILEFDPPRVNLRTMYPPPGGDSWSEDRYPEESRPRYDTHRPPFEDKRFYDNRARFESRNFEDDRRFNTDDRRNFNDRRENDRRDHFSGRNRTRESNAPQGFAEDVLSDPEWPDEDMDQEPQEKVPRLDICHKPANTNKIQIEDILNPPGRYNRAPRIVIILRGPPGSGKTFLAKLIKDREVENGGSAPRILSLDDYFMVEQEKEVTEDGKPVKIKDMVYEYEGEMEESYRTSLMKSFKKTITDGYFSFIIVDNVNDKVKYFGEMWSFAKQHGFQVYICQMELDVQTCSKRNIHGRTEEEIEACVAGFEPTPSHHPVLDATSLLQSVSIPEVEMEEVNSPDNQLEELDSGEDQVTRSKWDNFDCSLSNLARLDGVNKPLRPSRTMEEYLQVDSEWTPAEPAKPGQKRVRWADLEEQKQQRKLREIGFVVGQTNWDRMMDPTEGGSALTQTKYIEKTGRFKVSDYR